MAVPTKPTGDTTPGRRGKKGTNNQYFEVGKVGRKTGITLKDTGVRDEHGLEPVSGIFSSSPAISVQHNLDHALEDEDDEMDVEESSAPDVTATLGLRKTPRLPPARQSTPRHTNIGSPKRMSSVRPGAKADSMPAHEISSPTTAHKRSQANRVLDFAGANNRTRKSLYMEETQSPFKPRKALRRSQGPPRPDPFSLQDSPDPRRDVSVQQNDGEDDFAPIDEEVEPSIENLEQDFNAPMVDDEDDYDVGQSLPNEADPHDATGNMDATLMAATAESALARMRGQKRDRTSLQGVDDADRADSSMLVTDSQPPPQKRKRGRPRKSDTIVDVAAEVGAIGESQVASGDQSAMDNGEGPSTLNVDEEVIAEEPIVKRKRGRPPKGSKPKTPENPKSPTKAPKSIQSPSKSGARGASVGPVSNVHLRATTPFEDAQNNASRFGRNLIKPLKYWANESRIYRNGDIEGIVRAEPVEIVSKARARKSRKKGRKPAQKLEDIEEVGDTESILPDEWEDERGVLAFDLANYDPATGTGDIDDAIRQDIAFAESAIIPRDVPGSDFRYAKILTLPFFGAGLVEVPPGGFKRAKNSRRMQLTFFVHEGKVAVDMSAGEGCEVNSFAITKGGVWVVPRGNNYSIENHSTTKTAKLFFAQGSEGAAPAE